MDLVRYNLTLAAIFRIWIDDSTVGKILKDLLLFMQKGFDLFSLEEWSLGVKLSIVVTVVYDNLSEDYQKQIILVNQIEVVKDVCLLNDAIDKEVESHMQVMHLNENQHDGSSK